MRFCDALQHEDPVNAIFSSALKVAFDANNAATEHIDRLSPEARLVYLVCCLDGEIHNGGFCQFFFNSLGDHWAELLSHLDTIGAVISKGLLTEAIAIFPHSAPPRNREERIEQLDTLDDSKVDVLLSALDEHFWKYEDDLAHRLSEFVVRHPNATIAVSDGL